MARVAASIDPRLLLARSVTERDWTAQVRQVASLCHWATFRDQATNARRRCPACHALIHQPRNEPGWPDLVLCRPPRLIVAELKTERRKPTDPQTTWLELLRGVPGLEVFVWRPSDIEAVLAVLR